MHTTAQGLTRRHRVTLVLVSVFVAILATQFAAIGPASAHDQLTSSEPAVNEHLTVAPTEVILRFSQEVLTLGGSSAFVTVVDSDGKEWTEGEPVVEGATVTVALKEAMADGSYEIRWQVISADGHPISDIVPFTVGQGAATETTAPPASAEAVPETEAPPASAEAAPALVLPEALRPILIGAAGAVLALLLWWALNSWNRRRHHTPLSNSNDPTTPDGSPSSPATKGTK
jgi:methionine-rich copper-binding protein CopC